MSISINLGSWNGIFAVPNVVVDNSIKLAGAAQLKVLLWVLRYSGKSFSAEEIAEGLSLNPADVRDAVGFWISVGVLCEKNDTLVPSDAPVAVANKPAQAEAPKPRALSRAERPTQAFVAERITNDEEIAFLMQEAELILSRPLSPADSGTLLMMHDNDGLPAPVILMILQLAFSQQKGMKYVESVGAQWAAIGISTIEQADEQIRKIDESKRAWRIVQSTLGIDRHSPTAKESDMAEHWVLEWKLPPELIREAYEICIDTKGKYYPAYVNKILEKWHIVGLDTVEKVRADRAQRANKKDKKSSGINGEPSYDIDAFESSSMFDDD